MTSDVFWLTPQDVGLMVGFSESLIYKEIKAGHLPAVFVKEHRRWRIHHTEAHAYHVRLYGIPPSAYSAPSAHTS